jgi:hypothetical protein
MANPFLMSLPSTHLVRTLRFMFSLLSRKTTYSANGLLFIALLLMGAAFYYEGTQTSFANPYQGPVPYKAKPAPAQTTPSAGNALGSVGNKVKDFFKPTGRTVPGKTTPTTSATPPKPGSTTTYVIRPEDLMPAGAMPPKTIQPNTPLAPSTVSPVVPASTPPTPPTPPVAPSPSMVPPVNGLNSPAASGNTPYFQSPLPGRNAVRPEIDETQISELSPPKTQTTRIDDKTNPLGVTVARERTQRVSKAMSNGAYADVKTELFSLRQWLIEATEAHMELYKTLNELPSARVQAEFEKQLAIEFAKLRDQVLFETGRYYAKFGQREKAVKELVEVVRSQSKSELGIQAYELLQSIGFTEQLRVAN